MILDMKKSIFIALSLLFGAASLQSCTEELSDNSQIIDSEVIKNDFDLWLDDNMLEPYNLEVLYRFSDIISDNDFVLSPADYDQSILLAKLVRYLVLQPYDDVTGSRKFIKAYFPKTIHLVGSVAYQDGSVVLGTADAGKLMTLYNVNNLSAVFGNGDIEELNDSYFHTMHHEFAHILHQTKPYTSEFNAITSASYVGDAAFSTYGSTDQSRKDGFITPYSSTNSDEDFVELLSYYITVSSKTWAQIIADGGETGGPIMEQKIDIVKNYLLTSWGIDADVLRSVIMKRQSKVWDEITEGLN